MPSRLIRCLLALEFLIAIEVWLTFWSEVGGQDHLDMMFWPWKFGLTLAAAGLTTGLTAEIVRAGHLSRRGLAYLAGFLVTVLVAGIVTFYYHANEPTDGDDDDSSAARTTELRSVPGSCNARFRQPADRSSPDIGRSAA